METKELLEDNNDWEMEVQGRQYIVIGIENELFAININHVESILNQKTITRVPSSQEYFKGIINLRGEIIPMMNLRLKMGFDDKEFGNKTRFVILRIEGKHSFGIITDEVKEVINLSDKEIDKIEYKANKRSEYFGTGIGRYDKELITILDLEKLIEDTEEK